MLFESAHLRITAEYGVATLWLAFPGAPVNALDYARLTELGTALRAIESNPFVSALVVRSAKPAGFCAGLHPSVAHIEDRAAFARHGQRVFARLGAVPFATVAFVEGECLGTGFELALACDYRLCLASPDAPLGFPQGFACFGGSQRVRAKLGRSGDQWIASGRTLSAREARDLGLVGRAFCARRAKIELRTFLDELERNPRVPSRRASDAGLAEERRAFATADLGGTGFPACVPTDIDTLLARGFITPLEAEQRRARVAPPAALAVVHLDPTSRRAA
jgi:enoyl-CoA hydratase/carnithine racemase